MSAASLVIPAQVLRLQAIDDDGRWLGTLQVGVEPSPTVLLRVEAYALDTTSDVVLDLIAEAESLAECGSPLQSIRIQGRDALLVAIPCGR
jgi:hypothetical protein